jgi:2-dehydro-3-deoxyphosphogluconate aldolase/(4S)-4-hydroxy-2-oxoglutarate aldolase
MRARALGADLVKLFPASTYGPGHLRALRTVFPEVAFVPTGGVDAENVAAWAEAGASAVAVGGALTQGDVRENARQLVTAWAEARRAEPSRGV